MARNKILVILSVFCLFLTGCVASNPQPNVVQIETELEINIPDKYELIEADSEWFGFDVDEAFSFKFTDLDFEQLLSSISSSWTKEGNGYQFRNAYLRMKDINYCALKER